MPPFDRAIAELEAYVRATFAPLGIVASGSIVRGDAGPTSDVDVFVIHAEPWRLREQRRFAGIPAELFVNPAAQVRRYFASEHEEGRPCTAHMLATGEVLGEAHPVIAELIDEARAWLLRPVEPTALQLTQHRYATVDLLDDARDVAAREPAAAHLLLAEVVRRTIDYAFWSRGRFVPRRKAMVAELDALDSTAATLVRRLTAEGGVATVEALARHVLSADGFFEWSSAREPVAP